MKTIIVSKKVGDFFKRMLQEKKERTKEIRTKYLNKNKQL